MLKSKIATIKDTILEYNPYFDNGYDDVYITETGVVANDKVIFPTDKKGNYFYLRLPDNIIVLNASEYKVSDCRTAMGLVSDIYLIASVKKGDADKLLDNLFATLGTMGVRVKSAIWQRNKVIMQELAKAGEEAQLKALQNANSTMVSIRFEYICEYVLTKLNCITNPCEC